MSITDKQKDDILSLAEEVLDEVESDAVKLQKIEDQALLDFDMKAIAIKNRLVQDPAVSDEELEGRYLQEIESLRADIVAESQQKINKLLAEKEG